MLCYFFIYGVFDMEEYFNYMGALRDECYECFSLEELQALYKECPDDAIFAEVMYRLQRAIIMNIIKYKFLVDEEQLCSLASESVYKSLNTYNGQTKFITFTLGNIVRSFCSEIQHQNRDKAKIQYYSCSLQNTLDNSESPYLFCSDKNLEVTDFIIALQQLKLSDDEMYFVKSILVGKQYQDMKDRLSQYKVRKITKHLRNLLKSNPEVLQWV